MGLPDNLLYTPEHQWVKINQNQATIGVTYYGQLQLGEVIYVELPQVGISFSKSDPIAILESSKAAVEVLSPLGGKVLSINQALAKAPEIINQSPYEKGWLCILEMASLDEKNNLLSPRDYETLLEGISENHKNPPQP